MVGVKKRGFELRAMKGIVHGGRQVNKNQEYQFQDVKRHKTDCLSKGSKLKKVGSGQVGQQVGMFQRILCTEVLGEVKSSMLCMFDRERELCPEGREDMDIGHFRQQLAFSSSEIIKLIRI